MGKLHLSDDLGGMATTEFAPPKGLEPWEGAVLLTERVDDGTVEAWLSGLAGHEAVELGEQDDKLTIASGAKRDSLSDTDAALLAQIQGGKSVYVTGTYDPAFAAAWGQVAAMQRERIAASGWWKHLGPGEKVSVGRGGSPFKLIVFAAFAFLWFGSGLGAVLGLLRSWPLALIVGLAFPAAVAFFLYRVMLPARSAQGSALALRTESFRRFLHASEGQHVEWAWSKGLLREYSGWAVALGEADAWSTALASANVPAPARASMGPIIVAGRRSSINASRTRPSPSGSSGGGRSGGFRGGRVGGGGGGGSRGSW